MHFELTLGVSALQMCFGLAFGVNALQILFYITLNDGRILTAAMAGGRWAGASGTCPPECWC